MALINCPECGKEVSDNAVSCPNCGYPIRQNNYGKSVSEQKSEKYIAPLSNDRLITGIVAIVFCPLVVLNYTALFLSDVSTESIGNHSYGSFAVILLLVAGITSIASRNSQKTSGALAAGILFALVGVDLLMQGTGSMFLFIVGLWSLYSAIVCTVAIRKMRKENEEWENAQR